MGLTLQDGKFKITDTRIYQTRERCVFGAGGAVVAFGGWAMDIRCDEIRCDDVVRMEIAVYDFDVGGVLCLKLLLEKS